MNIACVFSPPSQLISNNGDQQAQKNAADIKQLQDNYREFLTILNRRGGAVATDLYFDGEVNYFKELPSSDKMTGELYKKLKEKTFNRTLI